MGFCPHPFDIDFGDHVFPDGIAIGKRPRADGINIAIVIEQMAGVFDSLLGDRKPVDAIDGLFPVSYVPR